MNTTFKIINGILVGAIIGAGIALLSAPAAGDKTRSMIKKKSKRYSRQALEAVGAYIDSLKKNYNDQIDSYADSGKSTIDQVKESVKVKSTS